MEAFDEIFSQYREVIDKMEELNNQKKELQSQKDYIGDMIIAKMREQGIKDGSSLKIEGIGTASTKTESYPQIKDMGAFVKWVYSHGQAHCLRANSLKDAPYRELIDSGEEVDGVESFDKTKLSFRRK
jgi:hypothetical protein